MLPWYRTTIPQMVMAGFLPFSAIYVELYYIFASVWGHKVRAAVLHLCASVWGTRCGGAACAYVRGHTGGPWPLGAHPAPRVHACAAPPPHACTHERLQGGQLVRAPNPRPGWVGGGATGRDHSQQWPNMWVDSLRPPRCTSSGPSCSSCT